MRAESAVEPTKVREHHRDLAALGAVFGSDARGASLEVASSADRALLLHRYAGQR